MEIQTCIKSRQKKELNAENFYRKSIIKQMWKSVKYPVKNGIKLIQRHEDL